MKPSRWILFSGFIWLAIGAMLLNKGIKLIADGNHTYLFGFSFLIGFIKGRFVLARTVQRVVKRIISLPKPIRFKDVYPPAYYILIGGMFCLGMLFRFLPIAPYLRGAVDVAVGSALINGALLYFKAISFYGRSFLDQSHTHDKAAQSE